MRNRVLILFCIMAFSLFLHNSCSTASSSQNTLTVTVATGVNGTPASGTYSYDENEVVNYSYSLQTGYGNLVVTLDGAAVGNSGTVTMNANHTLTVTAEEVFNPVGRWTGRFIISTLDIYWWCEFAGGPYSGTTSGIIDYLSAGTRHGTYTVTDDSIEFLLHYLSGTINFTGTIADNNHMSGTWSLSYLSDNWNLER